MDEMGTQIGTPMSQFIEVIQNIARGQEELRQTVQRPTNTIIGPCVVNPRSINLTQGEFLLNWNIINNVKTLVNEDPHLEDNYEPSFDTFRYAIDKSEVEEKFHLLEERMKALEGCNSLA